MSGWLFLVAACLNVAASLRPAIREPRSRSTVTFNKTAKNDR